MNEELEKLRAAKGSDIVPYGAYDPPDSVSVPIRRSKS
jgi:hypothetical protein